MMADDEGDEQAAAEQVGEELVEERTVVVVHEVPVELVRRRDLELVTVEASGAERGEPALEEIGPEAGAKVLLDA